MGQAKNLQFGELSVGVSPLCVSCLKSRLKLNSSRVKFLAVQGAGHKRKGAWLTRGYAELSIGKCLGQTYHGNVFVFYFLR